MNAMETTTRVLERYEENLLGLPYPVTLINAAEEVAHPKTGEILGIAVPGVEELAAAVALALCLMPVRLTGAEVRFIRRTLGMSGQELAEAVGMDPATLSRWEHDKQAVGGWADKAIRMAAVLQLQDRAPGANIHPEDVVTLRPAPRAPDAHPVIEVHRAQTEGQDAEPVVKGWDAAVLEMAA
jgi:transcriptional regulator with XRE-family HTH domain